MLVSIVITNHNYDRFLADAIDSALRQSHEPVEVIVVDDGSTDRSREIIAGFGSRVRSILKENGGHNSSINAGFFMSRGEIVIFLDADDLLDREAAAKHAEKHAELREGRAVSKSQGYLDIQDETGSGFTGRIPSSLPPCGDYRGAVIRRGLVAYPHSFTSANAWNRRFLEEVLPLPESRAQILGPDGYLIPLDALFGRIASIESPVGTYRIHGTNRGPFGWTFTQASLERIIKIKAERLRHLQFWVSRLGLAASAGQWPSHDWRWMLERNVVSRMQARRFGVPVADLIRAPFRNDTRSKPKALLLSVVLAAYLSLPPVFAYPLARRLLNYPADRYARRRYNEWGQKVN
jgi:glycosyltransferase involved in cell wall biosynthesis